MVRKARLEDLDRIMEIYNRAKIDMAASGNPTQWQYGYPARGLLVADIRAGRCYVCLMEGRTVGVFILQLTPEPTYAVMETGHWRNEAPYGTIHRLAGDRTQKGIFDTCLAFCRAVQPNLRVDTHFNNKTMQHLLEKSGFARCGTIYAEDGGRRIAYQFAGK